MSSLHPCIPLEHHPNSQSRSEAPFHTGSHQRPRIPRLLDRSERIRRTKPLFPQVKLTHCAWRHEIRWSRGDGDADEDQFYTDNQELMRDTEDKNGRVVRRDKTMTMCTYYFEQLVKLIQLNEGGELDYNNLRRIPIEEYFMPDEA